MTNQTERKLIILTLIICWAVLFFFTPIYSALTATAGVLIGIGLDKTYNEYQEGANQK